MKASKGRCVKRGQESPSVGRGRVTSRPMCSSSTSAGHLTEEQPQAHREPSQRRPHRQEQPHCPDSQTNPRYWVAVNEEVDRRQVQKLLYSQSFSRQRDGERRASAITYQPNLHRQVQSQSRHRDKWTQSQPLDTPHAQSSICRTASPSGCSPLRHGQCFPSAPLHTLPPSPVSEPHRAEGIGRAGVD